jgi:hypothetical protein
VLDLVTHNTTHYIHYTTHFLHLLRSRYVFLCVELLGFACVALIFAIEGYRAVSVCVGGRVSGYLPPSISASQAPWQTWPRDCCWRRLAVYILLSRYFSIYSFQGTLHSPAPSLTFYGDVVRNTDLEYPPALLTRYSIPKKKVQTSKISRTSLLTLPTLRKLQPLQPTLCLSLFSNVKKTVLESPTENKQPTEMRLPLEFPSSSWSKISGVRTFVTISIFNYWIVSQSGLTWIYFRVCKCIYIYIYICTNQVQPAPLWISPMLSFPRRGMDEGKTNMCLRQLMMDRKHVQ